MSDIDLLNIFWEEANEHLETLNSVMLQVEMASSDTEGYPAMIKEMNRVAHSMKGAARAVGISVIETIAHYMEEVFGSAMKGTLELTPDVADTIYDSLDLIQKVADSVEIDDTALGTVLARLEQIVAASVQGQKLAEAPSPVPPTSTNNLKPYPPKFKTETVIEDVAKETPSPPAASATSTVVLPTIPGQSTKTGIDTHTMVMRPAEESIRVPVGKLDRLMAGVSELFVARMHGEEQQRTVSELRRQHGRWQREWRNVRTAYIRLVRRLQDQEQEMSSELPILFRFLEFNQRQLIEVIRNLTVLGQSVAQDNMHLATLTNQLQEDIDSMRLVPFESLLGVFQRMVRDLSRDTSKQIMLDVVGASVEIDKSVLDALKDPLIHLLRNSIDHGVELPSVREESGKPPMGRIEIAVFQRGSEIAINVKDDGQGIDANKVRESIVRNDLLDKSAAEALSDEEARTYIFYSGLSTNKQVTTLSGRGMGMDIVRDRVESLRGRVGVQSVVGEGTTVSLNVPVSLTRIRCIMLRIGNQKFAVPSAMVVRMDKFKRDDVFTAEGRDVLLINERPTPLASLSAILQVTPGSISDDYVSILALQAADRSVAFEVDELYSEQELVLKPLGPELARARFVSGAALLGSGDIIIVLDANDLVRRASGAVLPQRRSATIAPVVEEHRLRVLVVDDSITTRTLEKNILETAGFDVLVAMDGAEAWGMLPQNDFDVIISDVEMPKMNGLELCSKIKTGSQFQHLPVILLTSLGKPEQREAGLRAGADAYLVKSRFDQGELLEMIQAVL
jgi:two-component system, chemotaxis family, sensor kinase CheA